jgi:CRISPR-associated exonuclease Cas4
MDVRETRHAVGRSGTPSPEENEPSAAQSGTPSQREENRAVGRNTIPTYITGTHINYYFVCKRKLWLFGRGLTMEQTSDTVLLGKLIDESSYERKDKGIDIDNTIVIDWVDLPASGRAGDTQAVLHEVKKSDSMEDAHIWQVLYYLWYLKQKGVKIAELQNGKIGLRGEIDYPKLKQKVEVILTPEKEGELKTIMSDIEHIHQQEQPPDRINKRFCKTCSYFELCWVE